LRKYSIEIRHTPPALNPHRATDSKRHCSNGANQTVARQHFFGIGPEPFGGLIWRLGGIGSAPRKVSGTWRHKPKNEPPSGISQSHRRGHHRQNAPTIGGHAQPRKLLKAWCGTHRPYRKYAMLKSTIHPIAAALSARHRNPTAIPSGFLLCYTKT
jgi:hypothetical protein